MTLMQMRMISLLTATSILAAACVWAYRARDGRDAPSVTNAEDETEPAFIPATEHAVYLVAIDGNCGVADTRSPQTHRAPQSRMGRAEIGMEATRSSLGILCVSIETPFE